MMYRYLGEKLFVSDGEDRQVMIQNGSVHEGTLHYSPKSSKMVLELVNVGPWENLIFSIADEEFGDLWEEVNG